jgi:CheY-like chemotaxis protein
MLGIGASRDLPTVLIIDDDMVSREVMATVLTMTGYSIHTAGRGEEAIALLEAGTCKPEVILMDAQMPGLKGAALVKQLRTRTKASIYAMSGSEVPDDLKKTVDGHLSKPFAPHALQQLMEQHHPVITLEPDEDAPVINVEILAQLRGMMPDAGVRQIYAAVLSDLDKRATALQRAMAKGDTQEIRRIGHSIKGGCGMAGAVQAARVGARLEARGDQLDNVPALLLELKAAGRNLRRMLESEFPAQAESPESSELGTALPKDKLRAKS